MAPLRNHNEHQGRLLMLCQLVVEHCQQQDLHVLVHFLRS